MYTVPTGKAILGVPAMMLFAVVCGAGVSLSPALLSPARGENLVTNGSFEIRAAGKPNQHIDTLTPDREDLVGWRITGTSVDWIGPTRWTAADGEHCLDIDSPGGIRQTIPTAPGRDYLLQFEMAGNVEIEPSQKVLRVSVNGQQRKFAFDAVGHTRDRLGWERKQIRFTARNDRTTLSFDNDSAAPTASGVALDNVVVCELQSGRGYDDQKRIERLRQLGAKLSFEDGALKQIDLTDSTIDDADMELLDDLGSLEHVILNGCRQLTDAGLVHLKGLSKLQGLGLERTPITDAGLAALSDLKELGYLSLNWTRIGDDGLKHLAGLTHLTVLYLCRTQTTDKGLVWLGKMSQLQWLDLRETNVTDAGMTHLGKLGQLRLLCLYGIRLTDAGLPPLSELANVEVLSLNHTRVTDAGLRSLEAMPKLTQLDLTGTRVTKEGAEALGRAVALRRKVPKCQILRQDKPIESNIHPESQGEESGP